MCYFRPWGEKGETRCMQHHQQQCPLETLLPSAINCEDTQVTNDQSAELFFIMTRLLLISEDIHRPNLLLRDTLEPHLLEIDVRDISTRTVEFYFLTSDLKTSYYLLLYHHIIVSADIIAFQLKDSSATNDNIRGWMQLIPIDANPKLLFILESNSQKVQSQFKDRIQSYFKRDISDNILLIDENMDRDTIPERMVSLPESAVRPEDYYREHKAISKVRSFLKYSLRWRREGSVV